MEFENSFDSDLIRFDCAAPPFPKEPIWLNDLFSPLIS